jgi:flagellar hook-associated protein 2
MAVNPMNASTLRLMGLSSNLDTDTVIKQMMRLSQARIDTRFRARTMLEWKQEALNNVSNQLTDFRWKYLTVMGPDAMRLSSVYNSTVANVTGKNAGAVSVATTVNSSTGTLKIGQIVSLAKASGASTTGHVSKTGEGFKLTDKLGELKLSNGEISLDPMGKVKLNVNGTNIELDMNEYTDWFVGHGTNPPEPDHELENVIGSDFATATNIADIFRYINFKIGEAGGNQLVFTQTDYPNPEDTYANVTINGKSVILEGHDSLWNVFEKTNAIPRWLNFDGNGQYNIRINNVLIGLNKDMTIDDMIKKVNASSAGVTMSYDRVSDQFTIENKDVGFKPMTVWGMGAFGIADGTYDNGSMALVQINGEWIVKDTNTFDYRGVRITLNNTTAAGDEETVVTLKRDATEAVNKIKGFIDSYNTLIKKLEDMLKDRKTDNERAYGPLTDEEKSSLSEKQIEEWEAIAKKGLLRNDAGIRSMLTSLRGALYAGVKSAGLSPAEIGIQTGTYLGGTGGQIVLDEDKLRKALENDPERVMNMFMGGADSTAYEERGLLWRIDDIMRGYMNGNQSITLGSLENSIRRENEQIEKLQRRMYEEEERYYAKFAAMETALSKIQQQSDWFASMMNNNGNK